MQNTLLYQNKYSDLKVLRQRMRRQQIIRRRVAFSILTVLLIGWFIFFFSTIICEANESNSEVNYKYFTSYEVTKGDTLWTVATKNINYMYYHSIQDYIDEVMEINHMNNSTICVGESIIIPYFSNVYR